MVKRSADLRHAMLNRTRPAPTRSDVVKGKGVEQAVTERRDPHFRPGRAGKTNVTGYFPPEVKRQLRLLAAEQDTTIQNLLATALNDLFAKHGKPELAPRPERRRTRTAR